MIKYGRNTQEIFTIIQVPDHGHDKMAIAYIQLLFIENVLGVLIG